MNSIANWAKQHIAAARLLIALLHIYVFFSAIYLSQLLIDVGIFFTTNQAIVIAAVGFCIIAIAELHRRKANNSIARKRLQRFRFLMMGICCTLLLVGFFSSLSVPKNSVTNNALAAFTSAEKKEKPNYESYEDKQAFYKDLKAYYSTLSKKEMRKELRHQFKELSRSSSTAGTIAIALLIILLVALALVGIVSLSCSLACDGQGGLAWLVLIGGTASVIFLTILLVRAIRRKAKKQKRKI